MANAANGRKDVVTVGASLAGLHAAYLLSQAGARVRIFEARRSLGSPARTLIVTRRASDLVGGIVEPSVVNEIRHFELFADGRVGSVTLDRPDLVVERSTLVRELARRAESVGAEVVLGRRFVDLAPDGEGVKITLARGQSVEEISGRTVIGADGVASRVARAAGWARQAALPLVQAIVRTPRDLPEDTTRVWFVPEETSYFFWLIPESRERAALGLIGDPGQKTAQSLERFLTRLGLEAIEYQAAHVPIYTRRRPMRRRVGDADVYLVGDAAGQVKMSTVGGVVTGFRGARAVANAIATGGARRELRALRRELDSHLLMRRALRQFSQADYCRLLDLTDGEVALTLAACSRDEASGMLWQLCRSQPRVVLLGLRRLLAGGLRHDADTPSGSGGSGSQCPSPGHPVGPAP